MDVFCTKTDSDKRGFNVEEPFHSLSKHPGKLVLTDKQVKYYKWLTSLKQIWKWGVFKEQPLPLLVGIYFTFFKCLLQWLVLLRVAETTTVSVLGVLQRWHQPKARTNIYAGIGIPEVVDRLLWCGMLLATCNSTMEKEKKVGKRWKSMWNQRQNR